MKSLLVIDDRPLRKAAFSAAEKVLKKLHRLESDLKSFHENDQKLFLQWLDATFAKERKEIAALQEKSRVLARAQERAFMCAEFYACEPHEAWALLKKEDAAFAKNDPAICARIEAERALREAFVQEMMREAYGERQNFEFDGRGDGHDDEHDDEHNDDERNDGQARDIDEQEEFEMIEALTDAELKNICSRKMNSRELMWRILELAITKDEQRLVLKVWSFVPEKLRDDFIDDYFDRTGHSFVKELAMLRISLGTETEESRDDDESTDEDDSESAVGKSGKRTAKNKTNKSGRDPAADSELLKILYRRLVRRLHPDLISASLAREPWTKRVWPQVLAAYQTKNLPSLKQLWHVVLIRSRDVDSLSMSELIESQSSLEAELAQLTAETKSLKKLPGWRFSHRKTLTALKNKFEKSVIYEKADLRETLLELEMTTDIFESINRGLGDARRKKARKHGPSHKTASKKKSKRSRFAEQMALYD